MATIFERNEGKIDRIARVTFGVAVLSLVFVGPQTMWGLLGLIPIATGSLGMCPIYRIFGIDTCGKEGCEN